MEENQNVDSLNDMLCSVLTKTTKKHIGGIKRPSEAKLTPDTLDLISQRREMQNNTTSDQRELNNINKAIKKAIREDIRAYNTRTIAKTIEDNRGPKVFQKKLNKNKMEINKLTDSAGNIVTDRDQIIKIVEEFYGSLYASKTPEPDSPETADPRAVPVERCEEQDLPPITIGEFTRCGLTKELIKTKLIDRTFLGQFLCLCSVHVDGKVFDTRCKLVRELIKVGMSSAFLGQWVCLIEKESNRNTKALTKTSSVTKYGLYQIPNRWCREGKRGGECNIACESLLDDDIRDDTACAVQIFNKEGFKYWSKWDKRCKNDNFITQEIYKCPDLDRRSPVLDRADSLKKRREQMYASMRRYVMVPYSYNYLLKYAQHGQDVRV
ncbi:c-type lysozyme/alpha-lactalbumin family domain-containing protein [Phthorimaea operculella]|nr:c-type lysozyme/alpha-lactalbumin family domain-containing protein [Phthorimaea operculella]